MFIFKRVAKSGIGEPIFLAIPDSKIDIGLPIVPPADGPHFIAMVILKHMEWFTIFIPSFSP